MHGADHTMQIMRVSITSFDLTKESGKGTGCLPCVEISQWSASNEKLLTHINARTGFQAAEQLCVQYSASYP